MGGDYDWDLNCAIVDRLFYMEYMIRSTFVVGGLLLFKDLYYIRHNFYADRALKRIPVVIKYFFK